ncbi:MAG: hypothetical protein BWX77_00719 [Bacteroidetes bacterium ADurb.Bin090]|nr:MAG: hypothetical protein BWX77_00719 [Bacteroidetes bacterium ADurb.Bin090]
MPVFLYQMGCFFLQVGLGMFFRQIQIGIALNIVVTVGKNNRDIGVAFDHFKSKGVIETNIFFSGLGFLGQKPYSLGPQLDLFLFFGGQLFTQVVGKPGRCGDNDQGDQKKNKTEKRGSISVDSHGFTDFLKTVWLKIQFHHHRAVVGMHGLG